MKLNHLCRIALGTVMTLSPVVLLAQSSGQTTNPNSSTTPNTSSTANSPTSNETMQTDSSGSMGAHGQMMNDRKFVKEAGQGGLAEIQLAQIALRRSNNPEVRQFAQKMITDHTMLNDKMKPFAEEMRIAAPTQLSPKDQAEADKLSTLSGTSFDKEYLDYMVKDHHNDLKEFRQESRNAADPQLKATVTDGAKVIAQHTRMIDSLATRNGVSVPSGSM